MISEVLRGAQIITGLKKARVFNMEGPTRCNRDCSYCEVHKRDDKIASSLEEGRQQIRWGRQQGSDFCNLAGGECLAHFKTADGLTYAQHYTGLAAEAHRLGMIVNISTNGDPIDPKKPEVVLGLKEAGVDTLTLTLHNIKDAGKLIEKARVTADIGIIPIVSIVQTKDNAENIPKIVRMCVENGIPCGFTVVQERGEFSAKPARSQIPSPEQFRYIAGCISAYKRAGFITDSMKYLMEVPNYPFNSWQCNSGQDSFIHVRSIDKKGEIGICSEVRTGFQTGEVSLKSKSYKERKQELVESCTGCLYRCNFEAENQNWIDELPTLAVMALIKTGHADLVRKWGKLAVALTPQIPDPLEIAEGYLGSVIDRAIGRTRWREVRQFVCADIGDSKAWTYEGDDRTAWLKRLNRAILIQPLAFAHSAVAFIFPSFARDSQYVLKGESSALSAAGMLFDVAAFFALISNTIGPYGSQNILEYFGLKLAMNAATHMGWDLVGASVRRLQTLRKYNLNTGSD